MLITITGEIPTFLGDTETYVSNVLGHVAKNGHLPAGAHRSDTCPECGTQLDEIDEGTDHIAVVINGRIFVIVGCEGYWVIDPSMVGMDRGGWMSLTEQADMF